MINIQQNRLNSRTPPAFNPQYEPICDAHLVAANCTLDQPSIDKHPRFPCQFPKKYQIFQYPLIQVFFVHLANPPSQITKFHYIRLSRRAPCTNPR